MSQAINDLVAFVLRGAPSVRVLSLEQVEARMTDLINELGYESNIAIEDIAATDAWKQHKMLHDTLQELLDAGCLTATMDDDGELIYKLTEMGKEEAEQILGVA